jgi:hypothetical protein
MTRFRFAAALIIAVSLMLVLAQPAMAADGEGVLGRLSEKSITFIMFGVIAFFPILVISLALIQGRLEARKERRRYDLERLG